jgi:two-component sensor histidine kinase
MALIHQKLYQNENLATIDFAEYAEQLMSELATIYPSASKIKTKVEAKEEAHYDIDTAIPLGLILNELVSNAYKYAFDGRKQGELNVEVKSLGSGKHQLTVTDTGAGLPENFDFQKAKSLGLRLVRRLAKQLYGNVEYSNIGGAKFVINFTDTLQRKAN